MKKQKRKINANRSQYIFQLFNVIKITLSILSIISIHKNIYYNFFFLSIETSINHFLSQEVERLQQKNSKNTNRKRETQFFRYF